jgi:hypothetical protein
MPEILSGNNIYTRLISDHQHYGEDGGCTFHRCCASWEIVRSQEGDRWKDWVRVPEIQEHLGMYWRQDAVNRACMRGAYPEKLLDFMDRYDIEDHDGYPAFFFTKGASLMRIDVPLHPWYQQSSMGLDVRLSDMGRDPAQLQPIQDKAVEDRVIKLIVKLLKENDAPAEQFERIGLKACRNFSGWNIP